MIRFFSLLARRPGVSSQEFHDHWRHPHGTMGRLIPGLNSYVQAHQVHTDALGAEQAEYEGVAISSFDSPQAAMSLLTEPQYVNHVAPDEPYFQDLPKGRFFSTDEEVLMSRLVPQRGSHEADAQWNVLERPSSFQLLQFVHLDGSADWAGDDDDELGRRIGAFRHARNLPNAAVHGDKPPFRGARQLWWPTWSAFHDGVRADPQAFDRLVSRTGRAITLLTQSERFVR
ncbi:EthD domain-containing protein [Micromonospora chokoriensis]